MHGHVVDTGAKRLIRDRQGLSLFNTFKGPRFISVDIKNLNLTSPSPDHNSFQAEPHIIVLNLIGIERMKFFPFHRPYIERSISLTSRSNNIPLVIGYINSRGVAFKNVAGKLFSLLEVDAFFAEELVVDDSFVKANSSVVVLSTDADCSGGVVVKGDKVFL